MVYLCRFDNATQGRCKWLNINKDINFNIHIKMEITGRLIKILPDVEGESQRGHWVRGGFVIETGDDYPRKVAFTAFGEDRVAMVKNVPMGTMVQVSFTPESREFNDRWYTDLRCSRVQPFVPGQMPAAPGAPAAAPATSGGYVWTAQPQGAAPVAQQPVQPMQPVQPQPMEQPQAPANGFAAAPQMPSNGEDDLPF